MLNTWSPADSCGTYLKVSPGWYVTRGRALRVIVPTIVKAALCFLIRGVVNTFLPPWSELLQPTFDSSLHVCIFLI